VDDSPLTARDHQVLALRGSRLLVNPDLLKEE
jgi:hypothetical protein